MKLSASQRAALEVLASDRYRGFDLDELAERLDTSPEGAAQTLASLRRRGLCERFVGGPGRPRVHYQDHYGANHPKRGRR